MSSKKLTNTLAIALAVIILGYLAINVFNSAGNSYKTATAYEQTVSETIDAKMFIIRDETVIDTGNSGVVVPLAVNGEKVGGGNRIAAVFADDTSAENYAKSLSLGKKLEAYRKINNQVKLANLDLKKLTGEIDSEFYSILGSVYDNDFSELSEKELLFDEMLSRKDISLGYDVDCSEVIAALESEIESLNVKQPAGIISAEEAGYYVSRLDGFEGKITAQDIDTLTPEALEEALESPKEQEDDKTAMGKLITGYEWYAAAIVDTALLAGTEVNKNVRLVLGDKEGDTVSAKVYAKVGAEDKDRTMVIFKSSEMNERLAMMRRVSGKIVLKSFSGIKVKKSAVHFDENGSEGVYIIEGNIIKFNRIEEIYSDDEYVIVKDNSGKSGWLSQYDEVIVLGKDLRNGKVIG